MHARTSNAAMMSVRTATPAIAPIFLAMDNAAAEGTLEPPRSVDAPERVILGVEEEELEPYTYEIIFPTEVGSAHFTETDETKAWNLFPAAV